MPQRGIAYQPRVQTLGSPPEKETRVLKERRIVASLGPRPRPSPPNAVFLQNTLILLDPAVPRAMPWAGMRCPVGANGTMAFPIRRLIDVARRPSVKAGASVPSYSGDVAAWMVVSDADFL